MLVNAPLVDQRNEPTADHAPDENASSNCADASLASGVRALRPELTADVVDGDALKDAVYGQGYTGATDPARFAAYLASQYGVNLVELTYPDGAQLVTWIRNHLALHTPVTGAIPSLWGNSFAGQDMVSFAASTHEVLWCDDDGANLTAMNPWGGFYQTQPYAWWAERIVYGRVFTMEGKPVAITDQNMGGGFKAYADSHNISAPNATGGEAYGLIDGSFTAWEPGPVLFYRADVGVRDDMAGHVVGQLTTKVRALQSQVTALQAQLAAAQANQGTSDPVAKACIAAIQAVKSAQGEL